MRALLRRTWLVALVTVVVCAGFAARAVAALVEASYLDPAARADRLAAPVRVATPVRKAPDGGLLVARNMFCSTCDAVPGGLSPVDVFVPGAVLIATSVGLESRATLRVPGSEVAGSFGVGDAIPGVGRIDRIGWVSVDIVDAAGRRGTISLVPAAGRGGAGAATPDVAAAADDPWAGRIKKLDHTFEVERGLVRELVSGAVKPGSVRILPVTDGGKLVGLRLYGASTGSVASALGLHNGDVLAQVNNVQIESANTLLDFYGKLDQLNVVELGGTRGGKPLGITLRLH